MISLIDQLKPPDERARGLILVLSVLLTACGSGGEDESSEPPPPARPVSGSLALSWNERPTFGGVVQAITRRGHDVFMSKREDEIVRFDPISNEWSETGAHGRVFAKTDDGYLFTDYGYRLVPGNDTWERIDGRGISIGSSGRTVYGLRDWETPIVSSDYGETWSELPAAPGSVRAILEVNSAIYIAVRSDKQGLWRLPEGSNNWERLPVTEYVRQLASVPSGGIVAVTGRSWPETLYWSADGSEWSHPTFSGTSPGIPAIVGRDVDGDILFGAGSTLYALDGNGVFTEQLQLPDGRPSPLLAVSLDPSEPDYVGGEDGVWRVEIDDPGARVEYIGLPGDYAGKLFHLSTGTYAGINGSLQRFDPTSNRWERFALGCCGINDIEELGGGELLLMASYKLEALGAVFLRKSDGDIETLMQGPTMLSSAVTDSGAWLVSSGEWREGSDFEVFASSDQGSSWTKRNPGDAAVVELTSACGKTLAATDDGLRRYANGYWAASSEVTESLGGVVASDNRTVVHSTARLWYRNGCDASFQAIGFPSGHSIESVALDDAGRIWVGTDRRGLVYNPDTDEWSWFDEGLPEGEIRVSIDTTNNVWVRVVGSGVYSGSSP